MKCFPVMSCDSISMDTVINNCVFNVCTEVVYYLTFNIPCPTVLNSKGVADKQ